jgi:hypothetical protein
MAEKRRIPESEAALVEAFCSIIERWNDRVAHAAADETSRDDWAKKKRKWVIYREACGWDLLLVEEGTGIQLGIEAKLCLNTKVLSQALPHHHFFTPEAGPDYRAVLVPGGGRNLELRQICDLIGLTVLSVYDRSPYCDQPDWGLHSPSQLPDEQEPDNFSMNGWHSWLPSEREKLPDYVPDVAAGVKSPIRLTEWKVRAIKLWVLLDRFGRVTRGDMKALGLSPTRFTDRFNGFLTADPNVGGYVKHDGSPDFRKQHPRVYAEIETDFDKWCPAALRPGFAEALK